MDIDAMLTYFKESVDPCDHTNVSEDSDDDILGMFIDRGRKASKKRSTTGRGRNSKRKGDNSKRRGDVRPQGRHGVQESTEHNVSSHSHDYARCIGNCLQLCNLVLLPKHWHVCIYASHARKELEVEVVPLQ